MDNKKFDQLVKQLQELTPEQRADLLGLMRTMQHENSGTLNPEDILTPEELDALLSANSLPGRDK